MVITKKYFTLSVHKSFSYTSHQMGEHTTSSHYYQMVFISCWTLHFVLIHSLPKKTDVRQNITKMTLSETLPPIEQFSLDKCHNSFSYTWTLKIGHSLASRFPNTPKVIQSVPGGKCNTSGECSLC